MYIISIFIIFLKLSFKKLYYQNITFIIKIYKQMHYCSIKNNNILFKLFFYNCKNYNTLITAFY